MAENGIRRDTTLGPEIRGNGFRRNGIRQLFFLQPLSGNSDVNYRALQPSHSYGFLIKILSTLNGVRVATFV